jgi:hypothetical protein
LDIVALKTFDDWLDFVGIFASNEMTEGSELENTVEQTIAENTTSNMCDLHET